mgnify:FL=1
MKEKWIEEYLCPGCVSGCSTKCGYYQPETGKGCSNHSSGTILLGAGKILLGFPKGFNRIEANPNIFKKIYETYEQMSSEFPMDKLNVPVWKYLNGEGHTFLRIISPRINSNFIILILESCLDKFDCIELTEEDIQGMD